MKLNSGETPHTLILHDDCLKLLRQGQIVADLGCGFGRYSFILSNSFGVIVDGFDINPNEIWLAEKFAKDTNNKRVTFEERDITRLVKTYSNRDTKPRKIEVVDNMYDAVILAGTIGVVEKEVRKRMLKEAYNILKPGGTMMVAEYAVNPDQKNKYEEDEKITGEKYSRVVRDPNGEILWIATHFTKQELTRSFSNLGLCDIQIRETYVAAEAFKGAGTKTRLQYNTWGAKPIPVKYDDRQPTKADIAKIKSLALQQR